MAFNVNRVTLVGRLGADPEFRSSQNGGGVVNMRVATSESWKDRQGQKQERTEWHTVAVFAHWLHDDAKACRKGDLVMIEGQIQTRKWQGQDGNDRYSTEVVLQGMGASLFRMAPRDRSGGGRQDDRGGYGGDSFGGSGGSSSGGYGSGSSGSSFGDDLDDDVPF